MSITSWFAADTFLHDGRNKSSRPIENNTRIERRNDDIAVRLHETDVITFHKDGSRTVDTGGWLTVTTKDRINRYLGLPDIRIWSDRGRWTVYRFERGDPDQWGYPITTQVKVCRYFDGITFDADGNVLNPPDPQLETRKAEAEVKMRKRIDAYVDGYMKALADGMPTPGGGDCWGCSMFERAGMGSNDHLLDHLTEKYYVPTMLWNAMKERGYRDVNTTMGLFLDYEAFQRGTQRVRRAWKSEEPDKRQLAEFRRILGKYLRKRLIPTVAA